MGKRGRIPAGEYEQRLVDAEKLLIRRGWQGAETELARIYGVNERAARRWLAIVKARWRERIQGETGDSMRDEVRAQIQAVIAHAWSRTALVKDKSGSPIVDVNPKSPTYGKPLLRADPDVKTVLRAAQQRRALDGLDQPLRATVTIDGDLNAMPDLDDLPPASVELLRKFIESVAPDGDVRKLAGSWFTLPEEVEAEK